MRLFFDSRQLAHAPVQELHNGAFAPYAESPARAESIVAALGALEPAVDHGEAPLRAVHGEAYLAFLWSAYQDWRAAGRPGGRQSAKALRSRPSTASSAVSAVWAAQ